MDLRYENKFHKFRKKYKQINFKIINLNINNSMKPKIFICANANSKYIQRDLMNKLIDMRYDVEIYDPTSDFVLNVYKLASSIKMYENQKIGIVLCNTAITIQEITNNFYEIKNLIVSKQNKFVKTQYENSNMITVGIEE